MAQQKLGSVSTTHVIMSPCLLIIMCWIVIMSPCLLIIMCWIAYHYSLLDNLLQHFGSNLLWRSYFPFWLRILRQNGGRVVDMFFLSKVTYNVIACINSRSHLTGATLRDKVCQWLATGEWFFPSTPVSSTNKTDCQKIAEILLKVTLNTINHKLHLIQLFLDGKVKSCLLSQNHLFSILPVFTIFLLDYHFKTFLTEWYFLFFICLQTL